MLRARTQEALGPSRKVPGRPAGPPTEGMLALPGSQGSQPAPPRATWTQEAAAPSVLLLFPGKAGKGATQASESQQGRGQYHGSPLTLAHTARHEGLRLTVSTGGGSMD